MPPARILTERHAPLAPLLARRPAIIGYGSQGRSHALNLRDSGVPLLVALPRRSKTRRVARADGFEVVTAAEAAARSDLLMFASPDLAAGRIYAEEIAPHFPRDGALGFMHGFAVHYELLRPPPEAQVFLVAPKGAGPAVRARYEAGGGVPALIAVHQGRQARKLALAWARGLGSARVAIIETTFREETETDLFSEQAVLCGGVSSLVHAAFEILVAAGYQEETAYFECLFELKLTVDLMHQGGIAGMRRRISDTAKWGDVSVGPRVIDASVRRRLQRVLSDVQSGAFARGWVKEDAAGRPTLKRLLAAGEKHPIEAVGQRLRKRIESKL